jgi:hypothetical protein
MKAKHSTVPPTSSTTDSGSLWKLLLCRCINPSPATAPAAEQQQPDPVPPDVGRGAYGAQTTAPDSPALTSSVPTTPALSQGRSTAGGTSSQASTAVGGRGSYGTAVSIGSVVLAASTSQELKEELTGVPMQHSPRQSPRQHRGLLQPLSQLQSQPQQQRLQQQHLQRASFVLRVPDQPSSPQAAHMHQPRFASQHNMGEGGHDVGLTSRAWVPTTYPQMPSIGRLQVSKVCATAEP